MRPSTATVRDRRRHGMVALAVLLLLTLTGCFKSEINLTINADDTVSGVITVGMNKQVIEMMRAEAEDQAGGPIGPGESFFEDTGDLPPGAVVEKWSDDKFEGDRATFTDIPLAELTTEDAIVVERDGDTFVFTSTVHADNEALSGAEELDTETAESMGIDLGGLAEGALKPQFDVTVTFPGEVLDANGRIDGNTVTWSLDDLEDLDEMRAVGSATDSGGGLLSALIFGAGVLLVIGGLAGIALIALPRFGVDVTPVTGLLDKVRNRDRTDNAADGSQQVSDAHDAHPGDDAPLPNPYRQADQELVTAGAADVPWETEPSPAPVVPAPAPPAAPSVTPGWYPTADGAHLRWHDGTDWTEHVQPNSGQQ